MSAAFWKRLVARRLRGPLLFALTLLLVEFVDELIYGAQSAALPAIRDDLQLSYPEIGLLLTVPFYASAPFEPLLGLLGDVWPRKALMVGGALVTGLALLIVATGQSFWALLLAFSLLGPASGAYVSLAQATLIDRRPGRQEQMMARWTVFGAAGQFAGPALAAGALALGFGWRGLYAGLAVVAGTVAASLWRQRFRRASEPDEDQVGLRALLRELPTLLRRSGLLRWLVLLELADLLLDVFFSFCALYFTDVVGVDPAWAGVAVAVLTFSDFLGDLLLIPLLERGDGLRLVRVTALLALGVYSAFLLVPGFWPKLGLLALIGLLRSGWYQVLQGRAYATLPGRSGTVVAVTALGSALAASFPLLLGALAEQIGLDWTMPLLLLAPLGLLFGVPRGRGRTSPPAPSPARGGGVHHRTG